MTFRPLLLAATALAAVVSLSQADASPASDQWLAQSRTAIQTRLTAAGLDPALAIRLKVSNDPGSYAVRLADPAASRDTEAAALKALKGLRLTSPPDELLGRQVTFKPTAETIAAASR